MTKPIASHSIPPFTVPSLVLWSPFSSNQNRRQLFRKAALCRLEFSYQRLEHQSSVVFSCLLNVFGPQAIKFAPKLLNCHRNKTHADVRVQEFLFPFLVYIEIFVLDLIMSHNVVSV